MIEIPYIRIGTSYFKVVQAPTINGEFVEILVPWTIDTIKQDEGRDYLGMIPKYDGFTCIPEHINYKEVYGTFYNTYFPLSVKPVEGKVNTTLSFIKHIFGKQVELGLDYLQLLYLKPTQILPILCLVSQERATGKSTFLKWLRKLFGNNMTYILNESFSSQFNSDWTHKLLICIDEVLFNAVELTERLKNLSTTDSFKVESKGKDKREIEFFGKFILCSNNENNFIKIDASEIRFWVVKVPSIGKMDVNLLEKLTSEIPAFLYYLQNREMSIEKPLTRMWFTADQIRTKALERLIMNNRSNTEKELATLLISVMETHEKTEIQACPNDLLNALTKTRVKANLTEVRRLLKNVWKLEPQNNSNKYEKLIIGYDGGYMFTDEKGRYYTIKKSFLLENFDDLMTE